MLDLATTWGPRARAAAMSTLRASFFGMLRASGLPFVLRQTIQRNRATILMYHNPSRPIAERQLRALARRYNVISLESCVKALGSGFEALPKPALVVTFDDGVSRNRELLDLSREQGVKPTIFLSSGIVGARRRFWFTLPMSAEQKQRLKEVSDEERLAELEALGHHEAHEQAEAQALSRADIADLRDDVEFGSHAVSHPVLPRCSDDKSWREISESKRELEEGHLLKVWAFAYPNGDATPRDEGFVKQAGYRCALTTPAGLVERGTDPFRLPRLAINDHGSVSEAIVQVSGLRAELRPVLKSALASTRRP